MAATVKLPTPLRRHAEQVKRVDVSSKTVGAALEELVSKYPGMRPALFDEAGELKSVVRVFVGESDIEDLAGAGTELAEGAVISIIPPVAGA